MRRFAWRWIANILRALSEAVPTCYDYDFGAKLRVYVRTVSRDQNIAISLTLYMAKLYKLVHYCI
jgi:hypothetical protein